jgi:hypothetical protein
MVGNKDFVDIKGLALGGREIGGKLGGAVFFFFFCVHNIHKGKVLFICLFVSKI